MSFFFLLFSQFLCVLGQGCFFHPCGSLYKICVLYSTIHHGRYINLCSDIFAVPLLLSLLNLLNEMAS